MTFPSQVQLESHEIHRVNRARLALILHKLPSEIDSAAPRDIEDLIAVNNVDEKLKAKAMRTGM